MKVIFLDFDGVLNSERYLRQTDCEGFALDPTCLRRLKRIVDATNARIVLTSSWRIHWSVNTAEMHETGRQMTATFTDYGLMIMDKTPYLRVRREEEIRQWLHEYPDVTEFVVLDDAFLSASFLDGHFVKTYDHRGGLGEEETTKAIEILLR